MTDAKSVSSMEVPEEKLIKKVSGCTCQNMSLPCPKSCHWWSYKLHMIYCGDPVFVLWGLAGMDTILTWLVYNFKLKEYRKYFSIWACTLTFFILNGKCYWCECNWVCVLLVFLCGCSFCTSIFKSWNGNEFNIFLFNLRGTTFLFQSSSRAPSRRR